MNIFYIFALSPTGTGISGGDRIFIELTRRWSEDVPVTIFTTFEGIEMIKHQQLSGTHLDLERVGADKLPNDFLFKYIYKIYLGIKLGFFFKLPELKNTSEKIYLYSASDFWMDVFPCVILKLRYPSLEWIAAWFQTAPNPIRGYIEPSKKSRGINIRENKDVFSSLLYWLSQLPIKPLIGNFANKVIVNNEDEKKRFPKHMAEKNTIVLIGAVPLPDIREWHSKNPGIKKTYDAVFQGRFHPQKGVLELVDIWKLVVKEKPDAKLAMIGDGPLMNKVKLQITSNKLQNNIKLFGYVFDGPEKYKIFAQSKLAVHPSLYDSGGMASAEAMAFGLPCVGFNLKAYESYYPKGMAKVPVGNKNEFARTIWQILNNKIYYQRLSTEALEMIEKSWSWDVRAAEILSKILE